MQIIDVSRLQTDYVLYETGLFIIYFEDEKEFKILKVSTKIKYLKYLTVF